MKKELFVCVGKKHRSDQKEIGIVQEGYRKKVDDVIVFVSDAPLINHIAKYTVTEGKTGYGITTGYTIKECLEKTHECFMRNPDILKKLQNGEGYETAREIVKNTPLVKSHDSQESKGE